MVTRKARRSCRLEPVQGNSSRPESARGVCGGSPQNHRVTWLSHKTKTGGSAGGDRIRAHRDASMPTGTWRDRGARVGRTRTAATAWPCDEEECYMTYFPLRGLYHNLSARDSLVFCPVQMDSYILTLGFHRNSGLLLISLHDVYISRIRLRFICNKARFYTCNGSFSKDFHKTFL
jgi:hypothetical protein